MSEQPKRFEDWEKVDCNECGRYWTDQCDGVSEGGRRACTSFLATRNVVIPFRIKALEKRVKTLTTIVACIIGLDICGLIVGLIGELFFG